MKLVAADTNFERIGLRADCWLSTMKPEPTGKPT